MAFEMIFKRKNKKIKNQRKAIRAKLLRSLNLKSINEIQDQDIFIAAYPKSGNTWMQNLVACILLDSTSPLLNQNLVNEIIPDVHAKKYYKRIFNTMIFKTHALPQAQYKKVIHLVRDGRDVMVSYHKMGVNRNLDYPYSLKEMVIEGKGISPSKWHEHTREWINNPHKADILTVRYEDLHTQPVAVLQQICKFINVQMSDQRLKEIVDHNSIEKLRDRGSEFGMDNDHKWKNKPVTAFFRKGQVGSYQNEMDEELIRYFNEEAQDELRKFNYS